MNVGIVGIGYWGPNLLRNLNDNKKFKVKYAIACNSGTSGLHAAMYSLELKADCLLYTSPSPRDS